MLLRLIVSLKACAINPALLHAAFLPRRRHIRQEVGGQSAPYCYFPSGRRPGARLRGDRPAGCQHPLGTVPKRLAVYPYSATIGRTQMTKHLLEGVPAVVLMSRVASAQTYPPTSNDASGGMRKPHRGRVIRRPLVSSL